MARRQEGLTLIELMIVVAIIGILAGIAVFMFGRTRDKARASAEVPAMFGEFRIREEQYHLENNAYLSTGSDDADLWPPTPDGDVPTTLAPLPPEWVSLRMAPEKTEVYCSYVAIAGPAGGGTIGPTVSQAAPNGFGFTSADVPAVNWYYLLAECDFDSGSTTREKWFARSDQEGHARINEGD